MARKKNILKLVILGVCIIVAAVVIIAISVSVQNANKKDSGKTVEAEKPLATTEAFSIKPLSVDVSDEAAARIFRCKVEDISDSAAIVKLLKEIEIEQATGEYTVEVDKHIMSLQVNTVIGSKDEDVFNENMKTCSLQLLALIPELEKVEWTYALQNEAATVSDAMLASDALTAAEPSTETAESTAETEAESKSETVTNSLDNTGAAALLGHEINGYGSSAGAFQKLLQARAPKEETVERMK